MLRIYHALLILTSIVIFLSDSAEIQARSTNAFQIGQVLSAQKTTPAIARWQDLPDTIPSLRNEWLDTTINLDKRISRRILLAEQLGEYGGMVYAKQKKWKPLLTQNDKRIRQGFDQVYRGRWGTIHVIEAKGGNSSLGSGYGHKQGSIEWAVEAAEETIRNPRASKVEKKAAKQVLAASKKGKLEVHVVRTPHVLGEPGKPTLVSSQRSVATKAPQIVVKIGKTFITVISVGDVAYSGYRIHDTISRRHEFDSDIYAGKLVAQGGLAGTGAVGLGMMLLAAPEPTFVTKAIGGAILVSSLAFTGTDIALDYAHLRRLEERSRQLIEIDTRARHGAVDNMLRKMIVDPDGRFY